MNRTQKALDYYKAAALQSEHHGPFPRPHFVPKRIILSETVRSEGMGPRLVAKPGEYGAHVNQFGAVSVETPNGLLGVKLSEFEVIEWTENPYACSKGGEHEWGIDGAHSNQYCKKCFIPRSEVPG